MHVNTVVRPPAVSSAGPVAPDRLSEIASRLSPNAEVIAGPAGPSQTVVAADVERVVVTMAGRRPVTAVDVARSAGLSAAAAAKMLNELVDRGVLSVVRHGETVYYRR